MVSNIRAATLAFKMEGGQEPRNVCSLLEKLEKAWKQILI